MWKTVLLLLCTLIIIPFLAFRFDEPLTMEQTLLLHRLLIVYLSAVLLTFLLSTLSGNHSQVDKLWSILPVAYVWMICAGSGFEPRIMLMAVVISIWGIRLSYNFSRRGGYSIRFWSGEEDYRWPVLRNRPEFASGWKWALFNFFFISLYQLGLVLLITLPALRSVGGQPLSLSDYFLAALLVLFVVFETVADQQQWNYHRIRKEQPAGGKGFVDTGLWGLVRHPNYAAEQAIWIVFYFFSVSATGRWLNWSVMGALLLVLLFWGSSNFSESISAGKYPDYAQYQKRVPRFIPWIK